MATDDGAYVCGYTYGDVRGYLFEHGVEPSEENVGAFAQHVATSFEYMRDYGSLVDFDTVLLDLRHEGKIGTSNAWRCLDEEDHEWCRQMRDTEMTYEFVEACQPELNGTVFVATDIVDLGTIGVRALNEVASQNYPAYGGLTSLDVLALENCGRTIGFGMTDYPYQALAELVFWDDIDKGVADRWPCEGRAEAEVFVEWCITGGIENGPFEWVPGTVRDGR